MYRAGDDSWSGGCALQVLDDIVLLECEREIRAIPGLYELVCS